MCMYSYIHAFYSAFNYNELNLVLCSKFALTFILTTRARNLVFNVV